MKIYSNATNRNEATVIVDIKFPYSPTFYGYKYYIAFKDGSSIYEYLTNDTKLYNSLEEGGMYRISYVRTSPKLIAPNTASIYVEWSRVRLIEEVN